jgi:hypothetical protein
VVNELSFYYYVTSQILVTDETLSVGTEDKIIWYVVRDCT